MFNDHTVGSVTVHQLALSAGLQLDYAVFRGLVVISTGMQGIAAVAERTGGTLSGSAPYRAVLGGHPTWVTALIYADLGTLVSAGASTGLTSTLSAITDDLKRVGAVGLSSGARRHRFDRPAVDPGTGMTDRNIWPGSDTAV